MWSFVNFNQDLKVACLSNRLPFIHALTLVQKVQSESPRSSDILLDFTVLVQDRKSGNFFFYLFSKIVRFAAWWFRCSDQNNPVNLEKVRGDTKHSIILEPIFIQEKFSKLYIHRNSSVLLFPQNSQFNLQSPPAYKELENMEMSGNFFNFKLSRKYQGSLGEIKINLISIIYQPSQYGKEVANHSKICPT